MGSSLSTLRKLLEDQLAIPTTNTATDPTSTLLNNYINKAIRRIVRRDRPRELQSSTTTKANITASTNTVTIPTSMLAPYLVFYKDSGGTYRKQHMVNLTQLIDKEGASVFFKTDNTGDPYYYAITGTEMVFNKHFDRTESNAIEMYGIDVPTTLTDDTDTTELVVDYDLLIVYESAITFYQRDDDTENQLKFQQLANQERGNLKFELDLDELSTVEMDPTVFTGKLTTFDNPSVLFSS